jgi:hypothetical protein
MKSFKVTKLLLGSTKNNELAFANVEIGEGGEFTASFDTVYPFEATEEYLMNRVRDILECYDPEAILELLERYNCTPSELEGEHYDYLITSYGVEGIADISLYPESYSIDGVEEDIYFESSSCGQHDLTGKMEEEVVKGFPDYIINVWKEYHFERLDEFTAIQIIGTIKEYQNQLDEGRWIKGWLKKIF